MSQENSMYIYEDSMDSLFTIDEILNYCETYGYGDYDLFVDEYDNEWDFEYADSYSSNWEE